MKTGKRTGEDIGKLEYEVKLGTAQALKHDASVLEVRLAVEQYPSLPESC